MRTPIAVTHITNVLGIAIFSIQDDVVESAFFDGGEYSDFSFDPLLVDNDGDFLFMRNEMTFYVNEFMEVE